MSGQDYLLYYVFLLFFENIIQPHWIARSVSVTLGNRDVLLITYTHIRSSSDGFVNITSRYFDTH